jgi:phosphoglycolate phosphatase
MDPQGCGFGSLRNSIWRDRLKAVRAVVFDFDGTLVATRIDFAAMRQAIVDLIGRWDLGPALLGQPAYVLEMVAAGCQALQSEAQRAATFEREAMDIIEDFEMQTCPHAAPFPGVMETLVQLAARGYRVGIITRNGRKGVGAITSRYPLHHEVLFTREDVSQVKPHPEHLLTAIRALRLETPHVLMVGDHPTDVMCARAAGVLSAGVSKDPLRVADLNRAGADFLISCVNELLPLLRDNRGSMDKNLRP